jgi:hypothetical protein
MKPMIGLHGVDLLLNITLLKYIEKKIKSLAYFLQNYPFSCVFLEYTYVSLLVLHYFMLLIHDMNPVVEYFLQFFTLIRNYFVMPVLLYFYLQKLLVTSP